MKVKRVQEINQVKTQIKQMQQEYESKIQDTGRQAQEYQSQYEMLKREQAQDLAEVEFFLREIKEVKQRASNNLVASLVQCHPETQRG